MPKRKRKIPRITFREAQPINLSQENWRTIEEAYGQSISEEVRAQIEAGTTQFLQLALAEDTGLMNDAVQRISRLRNRAQSLIDAIQERPIDDLIREYADDELALTYSLLDYNQPLPARNYVSRVSIEIGRFVNTCNEVLDFSSNYEYWPDGGAWEVWIRQLTAILERHDLPTGVSKDAIKNSSGKPSQFTAFVCALQTYIPKEHRRSQLSNGAVAGAINKARVGSKPFVAPKKVRTRKTGRNTRNSRP